jgi:hypothetical protein
MAPALTGGSLNGRDHSALASTGQQFWIDRWPTCFAVEQRQVRPNPIEIDEPINPAAGACPARDAKSVLDSPIGPRSTKL